MLDRATTLDVLRDGEIEIVGRIVGSSNNAMLVSVTRVCPDPEPASVLDAVYKPILGERPLNDFPDGTLARREVAAWHVSEAIGLGHRPADGAARRAVRRGDGPELRRGRPRGRRRGDDPRGRPAPAADGRARRGHEQHRSQGRPHPGGRWRPPRPRRGPRRVLLARAQAADGALGLARPAARRRRARRPRADPGRARRRARDSAADAAQRGPRSAPRSGGPTPCSTAGRFPFPSPTWPAVPWPPF